jgi:hypothetical protein
MASSSGAINLQADIVNVRNDSDLRIREFIDVLRKADIAMAAVESA